MERVLPDPDVKKLMAGLAVGLAADCDRPESDVQKIFQEKLANARTLPFVAFVTYDGKWVDGFSGFKRAPDFLAIVRKVNESPFLQATPAVRKKLAGLLERAKKSASKEDWRAVMKADQQAAKTTGRCPERDQLDAIVGKARAWAVAQFDAAVKLAQHGGDLDEARKLLQAVKSRFTKEPEADEAENGIKALRVLDRIRKAESDGKDASAMRTEAAAETKDSRWTAMFEKKEGAAVPSGEGN